MEREKLRVRFIGAGIIAEPYGWELMAAPNVEIMGISDALTDRAEALAAKLGVPGFASVEALLADESADAVVNLTIQRAHAEVNTRILEMGKQAYSEKPLAMCYADVQKLVALADRRYDLGVCNRGRRTGRRDIRRAHGQLVRGSAAHPAGGHGIPWRWWLDCSGQLAGGGCGGVPGEVWRRVSAGAPSAADAARGGMVKSGTGAGARHRGRTFPSGRR